MTVHMHYNSVEIAHKNILVKSLHSVVIYNFSFSFVFIVVSDMTYNVFGGTLNPTLLLLLSVNIQ